MKLDPCLQYRASNQAVRPLHSKGRGWFRPCSRGFSTGHDRGVRLSPPELATMDDETRGEEGGRESVHKRHDKGDERKGKCVQKGGEEEERRVVLEGGRVNIFQPGGGGWGRTHQSQDQRESMNSKGNANEDIAIRRGREERRGRCGEGVRRCRCRRGSMPARHSLKLCCPTASRYPEIYGGQTVQLFV